MFCVLHTSVFFGLFGVLCVLCGYGLVGRNKPDDNEDKAIRRSIANEKQISRTFSANSFRMGE